MTVLVDTSVLLDYLNGEPRAAKALEGYGHRSISVVSWLELMALAPAAQRDATRAFLRSFERLSISEAIADEALRRVDEHAGLPLNRALTWATASANRLPWLTTDADFTLPGDGSVVVPYRWTTQR